MTVTTFFKGFILLLFTQIWKTL